MKEPESKPNYWSVVGLLLWSAVILVIFAGAAYLVGQVAGSGIPRTSLESENAKLSFDLSSSWS